jgi:uncharacterized membrane protein
MHPILFALIALVLNGLADYVYKRAADTGSRPHHFLLAQAIFFAPTAALLAYATGVMVWQPAVLFGSLAGACAFSGFYNFSRSLSGGTVSINAPLFRLNFMVTAALAILILGEPLTVLKTVGLLAALLAAWLLVGGIPRNGAPLAAAPIFRALIATLSLGAANFFHKLALMNGVAPAMTLAAQACVFVSLSFIFVYGSDRRIAIPRQTVKYGFVASFLLLVGFIAYLTALVTGQASVVTPVAQMGFLVTAALGITLLGERPTPAKLFGLFAALVALGVFAFG